MQVRYVMQGEQAQDEVVAAGAGDVVQVSLPVGDVRPRAPRCRQVGDRCPPRGVLIVMNLLGPSMPAPETLRRITLCRSYLPHRHRGGPHFPGQVPQGTTE